MRRKTYITQTRRSLSKISDYIRGELKRQNLTQQELGERIGKKREYISSLEQGKTDMQLSTFMLIAKALGLKFSLVVG